MSNTIIAQGQTLFDKLAWLQSNAQSGGNAMVPVIDFCNGFNAVRWAAVIDTKAALYKAV